MELEEHHMEHIMDARLRGQLELISNRTNALKHQQRPIEPRRQLAVLMILDGGYSTLCMQSQAQSPTSNNISW